MKHEESNEQQALFQWASLQSKRYPELAMMFHIPNGQKLAGSTTQRARTANRLKREGLKPGLPDICLPIPLGAHHGLYIELKRKDGGVVSNDQKKWLTELSRLNYVAVVCHGFEDAKQTIIEYLNLGD